MSRVLVGLAVVAAAIGAIVALRSTSMTVHTKMPADSHLVVEATARWRSARPSAPRLARALTIQCVAETSAHTGMRDFAWHGGSFSFEVAPSLDEADRRQLKGCLSDLRMPKLIISVDHMRSVVPGERL